MNKPPYQVPTMAEIAVLPANGFKVASTFSGCGGSCRP
jgi:DNA (cytosine-5)-methyltransferase 1